MTFPKPARLEHIGIAVQDVEEVIELYDTLLHITPYKEEVVEREGVRTHFLPTSTAKLELLEALGDDSPFTQQLKKRGEGLHHLAFEVDDIHAQLEHVREVGFTPLSETPRRGADDKLVFFLHPHDTHGVLIEFCQRQNSTFSPTEIPFRNGHLAVYEWGDARNPSLVMLHGAAGSTLLELEPLARALEPHFHVLALDFAGHGASDAFLEVDFSFNFFMENVITVMDAFKLERSHLFGFSMGGAVALYCAQHYPSRIDRLAVHNTNLLWDDEVVTRMMERLDVDALKTQPIASILSQVHGDWQQLFRRVQVFVRSLPALRNQAAALKTMATPVLVSTVDEDALFPVEASLSLRDLLPQSKLVVLPGISHRFEALHIEVYPSLLRSFFLQEE